MAKMTLLDMVQDILNDMDGDGVNSVDDTVEAGQVAQIIKSAYIAMMSDRNWPHMRKPRQLTPTTDLKQPTHMRLADDVKELDFIKYNTTKSGETRNRFTDMEWREPDEFLQITNSYNTDEEHVDVVIDDSGTIIQIMNDRAPSIYTSFDDRVLIFNSYDSEVESNLTSSKVQSMSYVMPSFILEDSFIPDLPDMAFTALLEDAKAKATWKLRGERDVYAEREASKQDKFLSRRNRRVQGGIKYPNYGRKRGRSSNPYFDKT